MVKLHGYPLSTCTRLVVLICKEKNIPYEYINIDLAKGEQNTPAFTANQPFGQVPYIVSQFVTRYMPCVYACP
jgi:glutathione S-transferase